MTPSPASISRAAAALVNSGAVSVSRSTSMGACWLPSVWPSSSMARAVLSAKRTRMAGSRGRRTTTASTPSSAITMSWRRRAPRGNMICTSSPVSAMTSWRCLPASPQPMSTWWRRRPAKTGSAAVPRTASAITSGAPCDRVGTTGCGGPRRAALGVPDSARARGGPSAARKHRRRYGSSPAPPSTPAHPPSAARTAASAGPGGAPGVTMSRVAR